MNTAVNKISDKSSVIDELTIEGVKITKQNHIANSLGNYFASVGEKFPNKTPTPNKSVDEHTKLIRENAKSLYFRPTDQTEVSKIITNLPNKASSGYDNISNKLLKMLKEELSRPLCDLFNASLEQGVFPSNMKLAEVIPLHKGKSRNAPENY